MFATNPMWRHQTQGEFFLLFNAALNYDNLGAGRAEPRGQDNAPAPSTTINSRLRHFTQTHDASELLCVSASLREKFFPMPTILTDIETRVLGSLIEKQVTTPEYYPLTLNALTLACNQKNNRHPVTSYSENQVADAVETLREKNLTYVFYGSTSRVPKYKHVMPEVMHLNLRNLR